MSELDFSSYMDRFKGQTGWVVGRGPTLFDYGRLASVRGPIFFVNDAVSQECHLSDEQPSSSSRMTPQWPNGFRSSVQFPSSS